MSKLLLVLMVFVSSIAEAQCPAPSGADPDGMLRCPDVVAQDSAWRVWSCAYEQVKSWHPPSGAERAALKDFLGAWKLERSAGLAPATAKIMLASAQVMGAQVCRVHQDLPDGPDSFLVVYAAAGEKGYSGPNLLLRELDNVSKVAMILPHSDSDGYFQAGPIGFQKTHAFAYVGNGHHRTQGDGVGDFVHHTPNLAYDAAVQIGALYKGSSWFHVHGDQASTKGLYRPMDGAKIVKAWQEAVIAETRVTSFGALNAGFTVDGNLSTNSYVKSELPAVIYLKQPQSLARIFTHIEKDPFFWDPKPLVEEEEFKAADKPVTGKKTLTCVSITYSDGRHMSDKAKCRANAQMVSAFYDHNSRGLFHLQPFAQEIKAPYSSGDSNEGRDMQLIKSHFPSDYYILPRICQTSSHAGSKIAWICGSLIWDSAHEVGHLFGLAHAGVPGDQYGDRESVMGNHQSNLLTAPQYDHQGWTPQTEIAVYSSGVSEYTLKKINDFGASGLSTVIIPKERTGSDRDGYVSFSQGLEYHGGGGGGSTLMGKTQTEYKDENGVDLKVISKDESKIKFTVEVSHLVK